MTMTMMLDNAVVMKFNTAAASGKSNPSQSDDGSASQRSNFPNYRDDPSSSVIEIGSVKVRFTQNSNNSRNNKKYENASMPPSKADAAKHAEETELNCCGVSWPPSRIPLPALHSNNRRRISPSRISSGGGSSSSRRNEERRNFTSSPVRRCTSERTQHIPSVPFGDRFFGKPNLKFCANDPNATRTVVGANRESRPAANVRRRESSVDVDVVVVSSRDRDFPTYDCSNDSNNNKSDRGGLIASRKSAAESTLDRFQKFRFGGDRSGRNSAGRRGSASGSGHKKKAQRSSDNAVNLKKLTDKLIQSSGKLETTTVAARELISTSPPPPPQPPPLPPPPPPPLPLLTSTKIEDKDKDDIFDDDVVLKLSKPESKMIVGSYYQRSIPFRSASFSQVHYSPEDRKYVRNNSRKIAAAATVKQTNNLPNAEKTATLPRTNVNCAVAVADINQEVRTCYVSSYTFSSPSSTEPVANVVPSSAQERVSRAESEPAESLRNSITTSADACATLPDKPFPQPPKRTKHKHKHRHRHCGRLYFSDENIFMPNGGVQKLMETGGVDARNHMETISVTISTPQTSDNETEKADTDSTIVEINIVNRNAAASENPKTPSTIISEENCGANGSARNSDLKMVVSDNANESNGVTDKADSSESENKGNAIKSSADTNAYVVGMSVDNPTSPSSPEDASLKPAWPYSAAATAMPRHHRKLTPQTSTEREDDDAYTPRRYHLFLRGDSFSEAESDQGDKQSISPGVKEGRLSPLYGNCELSDSDSRSIGSTPRSLRSPVSYTKRPLRGPYLEMIVNEQKKPENFRKNLQFDRSDIELSDSGAVVVGNDRAIVDSCHLRRSNTSPNASKLNVNSIAKRKISANTPFSSPGSLRTTPDEKTIVHHQRTTSSPSQLEYYPDQLNSHQRGSVSSQGFLHQLLRGSSERSLTQDVGVSSLKNLYSSSYKDTRSHIVVELYDTERSYVESLQTIVTKYLQPLRSPECAGLIEPYLVQEIFYQIPDILGYHEIFLEELRIRLDGWNRSKCIGDIFLDTFSKQSVIDSYITFINNWKSAKEAIKQTCQARPAFERFLESMAREHKGKLSLDSLLIMPVQRIPRYELLIQSLLKHTELCHLDYGKLQEALQQVHELAMRINCTERDSLELEQIENLIVGLGNLVSPDRTFLRYDLVNMISGQSSSRKERALFLFNDLLIITSVKRRSSTVKKPISPGSIASSLESNKYKLLMKIPLEHLNIVKVKDENIKRMMKEMEYLSEDVNTLSQMADLVSTLHCPHSQIEESIREMLSALNKQLNERHTSDSQLSYLELALNTRSSVENISVIFPKTEKRTSWEETFLEAKSRLNLSGDRRLSPEFMTSVPIRKTRAGLQFTCASAVYNQQDVWVCNSDGYVGQVCILSLYPEPEVMSCNGICNARILSITSVPVSRIIEKCIADNSGKNEEETNESIPAENVGRDIPDIHLDSSSSSDDDEPEEESIDEQKFSENAENAEATMWLGTEDGVVHIYNCTDSLRVKRNKLKIQHNSAVYCVLYLNKNVFVALANGEVYVYNWTSGFGWNTTDPIIIPVGCVTTPVSRMFFVNGKLWCICHNIIKILNIDKIEIESSFTIDAENNRAIASVAVSGFSVWFSLQNSAVLRVIHTITHEILGEISIAPFVAKMLSGSDDIIRQHKSACLRVTALLACKDLLWIGTSAGVILTLPLPVIKHDAVKITTTLHPVGVPHGHTGQVRFLTTVKCNKGYGNNQRAFKNTGKKSNLAMANNSRMLIISGGDGYEDFRSSSISEIAGREDSTNHLLIWRV